MIQKILCLLNPRTYSLGVSIFCMASLLVAYMAEHKYGIKPCALCVYMQYLFCGLGFVSLVNFLWTRSPITGLQGIIIAGMLALSFYHVGVENHWWRGPASCTGNVLDSAKMDQLSNQEKLTYMRQNIQRAPIVRCDQVNWRIFGISATIWNTLALLGLFLGMGIICRRKP
ncbi:MAG: disulfide bond formation protein B [Alphaproteobacteria bacterium]|nr:disulfide bond formation protein B [Alphaproteobacteria bacterium]